MQRKFYGHDGHADAGTFDKWMETGKDIKKIFNQTEPNLDTTIIYRCKDLTIKYWGSGDHKDGAPVEIKVEGDTEEIFKEFCAAIERNFPGLR